LIFQAEMTFAEGLQLTAIAMGIVFILLFAISLILEMFKHIPQDAQKPARSKPTPVPSAPTTPGVDWTELEADEDMMAAALVASMEAAGEDKDTNYRIIRITKL